MIFNFDCGSIIEKYKWIKDIINDRESPENLYILFRKEFGPKNKDYIKYELLKKIWKLSSKFGKKNQI